MEPCTTYQNTHHQLTVVIGSQRGKTCWPFRFKLMSNIKHAFRLLPVHPADRHLLTMEWNQSVYIDTCLPFGLRSAPKLFNILADLLSWVTTQQGVTFSIHYLDDFLMSGPPDSTVCQQNLNTFTQVCNELGIYPWLLKNWRAHLPH